MDSIYPEPLSRLHKRAVRKKVRGSVARFKTQPITFSEIQEVDEEAIGEDSAHTSAATSSKSELDLKAKFEEFKRQRDKDFRESRTISMSSGVSFEKEASDGGWKSPGNKTVETTDSLGNGSVIR